MYRQGLPDARVDALLLDASVEALLRAQMNLIDAAMVVVAAWEDSSVLWSKNKRAKHTFVGSLAIATDNLREAVEKSLQMSEAAITALEENRARVRRGLRSPSDP